uniref:Uncharacterized protein n=1 Tax=viral metagenome TaxID=1070528 RepID=A0A6H1ZNI0_9ZZZZ
MNTEALKAGLIAGANAVAERGSCEELARHCIMWMERCERAEKLAADFRKLFGCALTRKSMETASEVIEAAIAVRDNWQRRGPNPAAFDAIGHLCKMVAVHEGEELADSYYSSGQPKGDRR